MATYSPPFRMYLVVDPATGKRRQLADKKKAQLEAGEIAERTGAAVSAILKPSKAYYTRRYRNGKVERVTTGKTTRLEANRWIEDRRAMASRGVTEVRRKVFRDAVDDWLKEKRLARLAEKTLKDYGYVAGLWKDALGDSYVSEITADDVLEYFSRREAGELVNPDTDSKPGPRALQKDRVLLGSFFRWAVRRGQTVANPVDLAPRWRVAVRDPRALSQKEVSALLAACRDSYRVKIERKRRRPYEEEQEFLPPPHLYGIVLVALHTLLRLNNILALTWGNVDLRRRVITIPGSSTKNRAGITIPLTATLLGYLKGLERGAPGAPLFGGVTTIKKSFRGAVKRAGLTGVKFHDLRKTGATVLLDSGVPLKTVQTMGGWKTPGVLLKHYAASSAREQQRALRVLDRKLGS